MSGAFMLRREPHLSNPRLIMALPDAGYVGFRVVDYVKNKLGAQEFGRIESAGFSSVPWISVKDGLIEDLELLRNGFYFWSNTGSGNDVVIFRSEKPNARINEYVQTILEVAKKVGVKRIYIVGSFGAVGTSHLEPPPVLGVANMPHLKQVLLENRVDPYPEYKGIGTIHSSCLWFARSMGIEAVGLWSPIPYYIARLPFPWSNYPISSKCLLDKIVAMEGIPVDSGDLEVLAKRTEAEMAKVYDQLYEEAQKELVYPANEQPTGFPDQGSSPMTEEELKRMMKDIDDFFRKRKQ